MPYQRVLSRRIFNSTRTIALMDEFESRNENNIKKYDTLLLEDAFCIKYHSQLYWVSLYVQRKPKETECIQSSLTFTDFKKELLEHVFTRSDKGSFKVLQAVFNEITKTPEFRTLKEIEYQFPIPVKFNAQNSSNRSGYGNKYFGDELVHEGTLYGETTEYMFVGALIRRW